jgi:hypothetical protein
MDAIRVIEERAPYLLIAHGRGFAVVERRAGKLYPVVNGERHPDPLTDEGAEHAVGTDGWRDERTARQTFEEITGGYKQMAEKIW